MWRVIDIRLVEYDLSWLLVEVDLPLGAALTVTRDSALLVMPLLFLPEPTSALFSLISWVAVELHVVL